MNYLSAEPVPRDVFIILGVDIKRWTPNNKIGRPIKETNLIGTSIQKVVIRECLLETGRGVFYILLGVDCFQIGF